MFNIFINSVLRFSLCLKKKPPNIRRLLLYFKFNLLLNYLNVFNSVFSIYLYQVAARG